MRIAFVVQRYGSDVAGGAESLCRQTAHALAEHGHELTVLTTTARDYGDWSSFYAEGESTDDGVRVRRWDAQPGEPSLAARLANDITMGWGGWDLETRWVRAQGPVAPGLLQECSVATDRFDAVALWGYLFATTQLAAPLVGRRAVLVPTAHDEPMLRFTVTRGVMALAGGFAYLTPEERDLVRRTHPVAHGRPEDVVGVGLAELSGDASRARARFDLPPRFALYVGRIDAGKGVEALAQAHGAYRQGGGNLSLVMAGRRNASTVIPSNVTELGFVSDQERLDLMAAADVVVMPSERESLSLVLLEAWRLGRPTLATAASDVAAGQTTRSGGGLLYRTEADYDRALTAIATKPEVGELLGQAGREWTSRLSWSATTARWESLFERARSANAPTA